MKHARLLAVVLLCVSAVAVPAQAQVVNPRTVEFDPSADHSAVGSDSQPLVQRYDLQMFLVGAAQPFTTASLGKPAAQADGKIRVDFSTLVTPFPLADGSYVARVAAVGPTGSSASDPSNTFAFQSCAVTLGSPSQAFPAGGGAGSVTVNAGSGCSWTATSNASWVVLGPTSGSGTGQGQVNFTVTSNIGTARAATLTIGGQVFSVTQAAAVSCTYGLAGPTTPFAATGGSGTLSVTAGSGCAWTASSNASWLTVQAPGTGSGSGAASFSVAANTTTSTRSATLTAGGQVFTVTQAAAPCTYAITPASQSATQAGGGGSFAVSSSGGCGWSATSSAAWVTVTAPASGSGNGTVSYTVAPNAVMSARTATITAGGQVFTVTQAAAVLCTYGLAGPTTPFAATGGAGTLNVTVGSGCAWTATSNASWLTVQSPGSGNGNGAASFSVAANTTTSARSGALSVGGQVFNVNQAAAAMACSYSLSASSQGFTASGGGGSVNLTAPAGCAWTATNGGATWVTMGTPSGSGARLVTFTVQPNTNVVARTAALTIGGRPFTITQAAAACTYTLSAAASEQLGHAGGNGSVSVSCGTGCAWTAVSSATWVAVAAVSASGSGAGTVTYSVARNSTATARTATIAIGGRTYTVNQDAPNRPTAPKKVRLSVVGG
jgi:hypothetical protein